MRELSGVIISNERVGENYNRLVVQAPEAARESGPGQFLHVYCGGGVYSFMRRPLSIHLAEEGKLGLLFQIKGEGTRWLAEREPGDKINFIGPLGRGFELPYSGPVALVAGGIGIAPLYFLAQEAVKKKLPVCLFFGARNKEHLCLTEGFSELGVTINIATDDGSSGYHGLVTDLLKEHVREINPQVICACGPEPMLESVVHIGSRYGIDTQISLEARMACGIGACRGCVTLVEKQGEKVYENVCSKGPVFDGREVVFHE